MSRVPLLFVCKAESLTMYEQKSCAFTTNLATDEANMYVAMVITMVT